MAGSVRLAVTGIQDQWLTGEPQFSYFVMNYRRHTRFATEMVERPFDGQPGFGNTVTCQIPNNMGDLLRSVTLKVTLDPLPQVGGDDGGGGIEIFSFSPEYYTLYYPSIGTRMIEHADLIIGGQVIERLTGEYIYMYDQLHNNIDDTDQTLYFLTGHGSHIDFKAPYTFYVNLPFYFFRHPSLAIPLCALTKQLIEVRITFKDSDYKIHQTFKEFNDRWTVNFNETGEKKGGIQAATLISDFYFITDPEIHFLKTRPIEYVITQLQLATIPLEIETSKKSVLLHFKHPVKELLFIATLSERNPFIQPLDGIIAESDLTIRMSPVIPLRSDVRNIKRISLEFNEATVFDHDGTQLAYQQSLDHHTGCPSPAYEFYTYSFALKPEEYYPTGQVNMSRVRHQKLNIELDETDQYNDIIVNVYAVNYNVLRIESGLAGLKF